MKKYCIAVTYIGPRNNNYNLSLSTIQDYAHKWGYDLVVFNKREWSDNLPPHVEKFRIAELLESYDRVCYLDLDIIIRPNAPDIFDVCPSYVRVYGHDESWCPWTQADVEFFIQKYSIQSWSTVWHQEQLCKVMLNTGVLIFGDDHQYMLRQFDYTNFTRSFDEGTKGGEQTYLNMLIQRNNTPIGHLESNWNWMPKIHGAPKPDSWFIHYAGYEDKEQQYREMVQQVIDDRKIYPYAVTASEGEK